MTFRVACASATVPKGTGDSADTWTMCVSAPGQAFHPAINCRTDILPIKRETRYFRQHIPAQATRTARVHASARLFSSVGTQAVQTMSMQPFELGIASGQFNITTIPPGEYKINVTVSMRTDESCWKNPPRTINWVGVTGKTPLRG